MNDVLKNIYRICLLAPVLLVLSCEKEIDVELPDSEEEIVMEAYINQLNPWLNYVFVSTTTSYFNPSFIPPFVKGAKIYVSEGKAGNGDTVWTNPVQLQEVSPSLPGVYLNTSLQGKEGYVYKITAEVKGRHIEAVTSIPKAVHVDSFTFDLSVSPADTNAYMTVHFTDPATRGNNYRMMYVRNSDSVILSWPDIWESDVLRDDEYLNGKSWEVEYSTNFSPGDTINYYLISMDRNTYNFWDSYFILRSNNGNPFAVPIQLKSNFRNATGCYSGYGVSYRRVIVPGP